jgi:phosphoribosylformimino-5-aminoimidazole carboxamide ribotide isomerase
MNVIPAIDIKNGRCVRLLKGRFDKVTESPVEPSELAAHYGELGARWIHCVDLDGARLGQARNLKMIHDIVGAVTGGLQVGGGVRNKATLANLLDAGVDRVVLGSVAVEHPKKTAKWLRAAGVGRIVLALDVSTESGDPVVVYRGWTEESKVTLWEAIDRFAVDGLRHVLCTDVERDGAMAGPALDLYAECVTRYPDVEFQASGGVRDRDDLVELEKIGVASAIVGKALLDGRISDEELRPFLRKG